VLKNIKSVFIQRPNLDTEQLPLTWAEIKAVISTTKCLHLGQTIKTDGVGLLRECEKEPEINLCSKKRRIHFLQEWDKRGGKE